MKTKMCYQCKTEKPLTMFNKNNQQADGFTGMCKACLSIVRKKYNRKYNQSKKARETARRYYYSKKGQAIKKAYRQKYTLTEEQKERYREAARLHEKEQKYKDRQKRYRESPKGKKYKAEKDKRHAKTENGKFSKRKTEIKRKHQMKSTDCTLTRKEWIAIKEKFGNRCAYCGKEARLEMDHVIPLSRGGTHTASNIVPACRTCNAKKSNHLLQPADPFGS